MTAEQIINAALIEYAARTVGHDRALAERLAVLSYEMADAIGEAEPMSEADPAPKFIGF